METKELRIGNIMQDFAGNIFEFELQDFCNIKNSIIDTDEYCKPIPLTGEWFLKCKSNSIFNNGFEYKKTSTGRFEIYVGISLITVIEFLHELQNLNFALLGEDVVFDTES